MFYLTGEDITMPPQINHFSVECGLVAFVISNLENEFRDCRLVGPRVDGAFVSYLTCGNARGYSAASPVLFLGRREHALLVTNIKKATVRQMR